VSSLGQLHDLANPQRIKTFSEQNFLQKVPTDTVVCFFEVNLKDDKLFFGGIFLMKDLMESSNSAKDAATFNESRLTLVYDGMGYRG
jgi:hypothetical protein